MLAEPCKTFMISCMEVNQRMRRKEKTTKKRKRERPKADEDGRMTPTAINLLGLVFENRDRTFTVGVKCLPSCARWVGERRC